MAKKRKGGRLGSAAVPIDPSDEATQPGLPVGTGKAGTVEPLPLTVAEVTVTKKDAIPRPTTLASRVANRAMAAVEIVDMREDFKQKQ